MFGEPPQPPKIIGNDKNDINIDIRISPKRTQFVWKRFLLTVFFATSLIVGSTMLFRIFEPDLSELSIVAMVSFNVLFLIFGYLICWFCNLWKMEEVQKKVFAECMEEVKVTLATNIASHLTKNINDTERRE